MNRRFALIGLSIAAVPLFAVPGIRLAGAQTAGTAPPTVGPLDYAQYRARTLMAGTAARQSSEIALQRATNPRVKQFAGFEAAEQLTMAQILTNTHNPPPVLLDSTHAAMVQTIEGAPSGAGFDRAYVQGQIQGHQELLAIHNGFLNNQTAMTAEGVHAAMLGRTAIMMHLTMLQDLETQLRA